MHEDCEGLRQSTARRTHGRPGKSGGDRDGPAVSVMMRTNVDFGRLGRCQCVGRPRRTGCRIERSRRSRKLNKMSITGRVIGVDGTRQCEESAELRLTCGGVRTAGANPLHAVISMSQRRDSASCARLHEHVEWPRVCRHCLLQKYSQHFPAKRRRYYTGLLAICGIRHDGIYSGQNTDFQSRLTRRLLKIV